MPILKPQIQAALREAGLEGSEVSQGTKKDLDDAGLGVPETLKIVANIMKYSASESTQLRAAENVLKAHGLMKDSGPSAPSITIIISDPDAPSRNPILLPRELSL